VTEISRDDHDGRGDDGRLVRREEELRLDAELHELGAARARRHTEFDRLSETVPRDAALDDLGGDAA
jgi:hypothetical protein